MNSTEVAIELEAIPNLVALPRPHTTADDPIVDLASINFSQLSSTEQGKVRSKLIAAEKYSEFIETVDTSSLRNRDDRDGRTSNSEAPLLSTEEEMKLFTDLYETRAQLVLALSLTIEPVVLNELIRESLSASTEDFEGDVGTNERMESQLISLFDKMQELDFEALSGENRTSEIINDHCSNNTRTTPGLIKLTHEILRREDLGLNHWTHQRLSGDLDRLKQIRHVIILSNVRLAISEAWKFIFGVNLIQLKNEVIQASQAGLIEAVDRFDTRHGTKFSTYAFHWIGQSIRRVRNENLEGIRKPENVRSTLKDLRIVEDEYLRQNYPAVHDRRERDSILFHNSNEIADRLSISKTELESLRQIRAAKTTSLETPLNDDEKGTLRELVPDPNATHPMQSVATIEAEQKLLDLINTLPELEAAVIKRLYGVFGYAQQTRQEIAADLGISVGKVHNKAALARRRLNTTYQGYEL